MSEVERIIVERWDGPVVVSDRYYADVADAVERIVDDAYPLVDPLQMPEFVECCDEQGPYLDADNIIESMDNYDRNVHSNDNYASSSVDEDLKDKLQEFLDGWLKEIPWQSWAPNGKYVNVREDIIKHIASFQVEA